MVGLQVGQSHCSCRAVAVRQEGIAFWSSLDAVLSVGRAVHRAENIVVNDLVVRSQRSERPLNYL